MFDQNILAKPDAFIYKDEPSNFLGYAFMARKESITDCSTLLIYQSTLALVPTQFSDAKKRMQHVGIMQDLPVKQYPLLLSLNSNDAAARDKIRDFYDTLSQADSTNNVDGEQEVVTFKQILLQETLLLPEE